MAVKSIAVKDICLDGGTQQRSVEDSVMRRYAAMMKDGSKFPPVEIIADDKNNFLWDGFHRYFAVLHLGKKYIEANVVAGTRRTAIFTSFSANRDNAFPRPDGTVKNILRVMYYDNVWHNISVTEIAKHVGCPRTYVSKIFAEFDQQKEAAKDTSLRRTKTIKTKRGRSEYEMKTPEKKVLDSTGKQVPEHLVKFFERANEYRQMIKQLNDMLKIVRDGKNAGDLFYKYIKIENLTAEIGNVKRIFRFAMPYAVCRYCGGDEKNAECRACDGCGFVNEITYKATPRDLK